MGDDAALVMASTDLPGLTLAPLAARLDGVGIVEHARAATPTADSGHCTDDSGRPLTGAAFEGLTPTARTSTKAPSRRSDLIGTTVASVPAPYAARSSETR